MGRRRVRPLLNEADKQKGLKLREKIFVTLHAHIAGETVTSFSLQKQRQFMDAVAAPLDLPPMRVTLTDARNLDVPFIKSAGSVEMVAVKIKIALYSREEEYAVMKHFQRPDERFGRVTGVAAGSISGLQTYTSDVIEALQHIPVAVLRSKVNADSKKPAAGGETEWQWPVDWERKRERERRIGKRGDAIRPDSVAFVTAPMTYHVPIGRHNITELGEDFGQKGGFLHPQQSAHQMVLLDSSHTKGRREHGPLSIEEGGRGKIRIRQNHNSSHQGIGSTVEHNSHHRMKHKHSKSVSMDDDFLFIAADEHNIDFALSMWLLLILALGAGFFYWYYNIRSRHTLLYLQPSTVKGSGQQTNNFDHGRTRNGIFGGGTYGGTYGHKKYTPFKEKNRKHRLSKAEQREADRRRERIVNRRIMSKAKDHTIEYDRDRLPSI